MKLSVAVGVLLTLSSIEHATALSLHPRINTALSSVALKQPTAPVTDTDYSNYINEDGFDVDYITSALLEPPLPHQLRQQTSLPNNNGLAAPNTDVKQLDNFDEPEQQINQQFNPLTGQQFARHSDNKSFQAPNRQTQQSAPISNQQLSLRTNFNKQKVMTGRERRDNWESYAAPGIPGRKTAANTGGVVGSPGGIGDWRYSSSYGPATTTHSTGTGLPPQVSSMQTGTASFPSYSNGVASNQSRDNPKYYGAVITGAERRSRFHSFHSFEPIAPEVVINGRVSAFARASFGRSASVNSFHEFNSINEMGHVVGLGAERFANFNRAKPSIPAVQAQMPRPAQKLFRNNQSNLVTGAAVDQRFMNNNFAPVRDAGRDVQASAVNGAGLDSRVSLSNFELQDSFHDVQKDEQEKNGVAPYPGSGRGTVSFGFDPNVPPRDALTDSPREHVVTSRPLSANGFKVISPTPEAEKDRRDKNALTSRSSPANNVEGVAGPIKLEPFLPNREAQMSRQGKDVASPFGLAINVEGTARPNKFEPVLPNREVQTNRQGNAAASPSSPAIKVGGTARPNKFEPVLPNREAKMSRQGNIAASPASPAINVGGTARPDKFAPFVPNREPQGWHYGNAVASSPRSPDNVRETMRPNKFAPFVPAGNAQNEREEEDASSNQDLVSFLKNPRSAKKKNAKDVAASLSAMSQNPTFYNDFASPQVAEAPVRQGETYGKQSYDQNFFASKSALLGTASTSEIPMDTPARQSLPPYLSLCPIPGKGLGVITKKPIKIGEFIGNYEGEIMPEEVKDRRYLKSLQHKLTDEDREWIQSRLERGQTITGSYLYGVDLDGGNIYKHFGRNRGNGGHQEEENVSRIFVDAEDEFKSLWTRFINHASPPLDNLKPMSVPESYDGKPRVWFMAKRDIEAGEELCFDYGDDYWLEGDEVF